MVTIVTGAGAVLACVAGLVGIAAIVALIVWIAWTDRRTEAFLDRCERLADRWSSRWRWWP